MFRNYFYGCLNTESENAIDSGVFRGVMTIRLRSQSHKRTPAVKGITRGTDGSRWWNRSEESFIKIPPLLKNVTKQGEF